LTLYGSSRRWGPRLKGLLLVLLIRFLV